MAHLSLNKAKTIMRTLDGTDSISKEAVTLVTRATEMFIKELALEGYRNTNGGKKLNYENLVNVVHSNSHYEFLECMIPRKITVRQYKEIMRKKNANSNNAVEISEEESSEDSDSSSGVECD